MAYGSTRIVLFRIEFADRMKSFNLVILYDYMVLNLRMCSLVLRTQRSFSGPYSAVSSVDDFPRCLRGTSLHVDGVGAELLAAHPCRHNPLARYSYNLNYK